jgi:hypothetical protein
VDSGSVVESAVPFRRGTVVRRGKPVKTLDTETPTDGARRVTRIREAASLPPESTLELPLHDGWRFRCGKAEAVGSIACRLRWLP